MKDKVIMLAFFVLLGAFAFLLIRLLTFPSPSRELILLGESNGQRLVQQMSEKILNDLERMKREGTSSHPIIVAALEGGTKVVDMLKRTDTQIDRAMAARAWPDSLNVHLATLAAQVDQLPKLYELESGKKFPDEERQPLYPVMNEIDPIPFMPVELRGIAITRLHSTMVINYELMMREFAKYVGATAIKFDTWQSLLEKKKAGNNWISGVIAFNTPLAMNMERKERVQVRISKKFVAEMVETMQRHESVMVDSLITGDIMLVKLLGDDFKITAFDEEEQGVTEDGYTQWEFDVTPLSSGEHDLFLKVGVVYFVPNLGPTKKYYPVYEKQIKVSVSVWQQVAGFATARWEFIVSTIVIPLGAWGISWWRRRRKAM